MPQKVLIDGVETEVFSQAELEEAARIKAEEAAEAARVEAEQKAADEKALLEAKLKGLEDKDYNFSQMRKNKDKDTEEVKALKARLDELSGTVTQLASQPFKKLKDDFITANNLAGDKDTKEKFDYFYEQMSAKANTPELVQAALTGAFAAATGGSKQPSFEGVMVATRATPPSSGEKQVSQVAVEMGAQFGITDKDREKYGKKK